MSEDEVREALEEMFTKAGLSKEDAGKRESLPRIVVEEDSIVVFEDNSWIEKNVLGELGAEEEESEENLVLSQRDDSGEPGEDVLNAVLEEIVGFEEKVPEVSPRSDVLKRSEPYEVSSGQSDFYDSSFYDPSGYDVLDEEDAEIVSEVMSFEEAEGRRSGGRSMLEVAGFRDEEAEKRRKEKRVGY